VENDWSSQFRKRKPFFQAAVVFHGKLSGLQSELHGHRNLDTSVVVRPHNLKAYDTVQERGAYTHFVNQTFYLFFKF
jgi:hypothetical protein